MPILLTKIFYIFNIYHIIIDILLSCNPIRCILLIQRYSSSSVGNTAPLLGILGRVFRICGLRFAEVGVERCEFQLAIRVLIIAIVCNIILPQHTFRVTGS